MTSAASSSLVSCPDCSSPSLSQIADFNMAPSIANNQQSKVPQGPVAILWDIENCPVPNDVRPEDVAGNIRMALRLHPVVNGAVTHFSAYGDFNAFPRRLREGCQRTGVKLVDVPNGRKDAADKAILVDMFLFALDNPPPSSILLISGDVDFAPALHILGQRGYTIVLAIPAKVSVSSALSSAGRFVWDWPSVARGEGFMPAKSHTAYGADVLHALPSHLTENPDSQIEDESIIYQGLPNSGCTMRSNFSQLYYLDASCHVSRDVIRAAHSLSEYSSNAISLPQCSGSRSQSLPPVLNDLPMAASGDLNELQHDHWVQPGDIQGLKGQIVKLLELSAGCLQLVRLPSEYQKMFGRPLYVSEYGSCKLVDLLKKMADAVTVEGKGNRKFVTLRSSAERSQRFLNPSAGSSRRERKGKGIVREESISCDGNELLCAGFQNMGCYSDESTDDERGSGQDDRNLEIPVGNVGSTLKAVADACLDRFKEELQELLVSYSCRILVGSFEALYEQRYKKSLNYQSFGVNGLEELIKKVKDVAEICEELTTKRRFLMVSGSGGLRSV
ncbi:hypothetical protein EJ110_NYTH51292 [Nymphaea thermarum]|nr:hypothetical protein EJ110_NYTH51292 [Nymphaea thermarum]